MDAKKSTRERDPAIAEELQEDAFEGVNTGAVSPSPPPSPGEGITEGQIEQTKEWPGHPGDEESSAPESGALP